jgi:hypothetical protein
VKLTPLTTRPPVTSKQGMILLANILTYFVSLTSILNLTEYDLLSESEHYDFFSYV